MKMNLASCITSFLVIGFCQSAAFESCPKITVDSEIFKSGKVFSKAGEVIRFAGEDWIVFNDGTFGEKYRLMTISYSPTEKIELEIENSDADKICVYRFARRIDEKSLAEYKKSSGLPEDSFDTFLAHKREQEKKLLNIHYLLLMKLTNWNKLQESKALKSSEEETQKALLKEFTIAVGDIVKARNAEVLEVMRKIDNNYTNSKIAPLINRIIKGKGDEKKLHEMLYNAYRTMRHPGYSPGL